MYPNPPAVAATVIGCHAVTTSMVQPETRARYAAQRRASCDCSDPSIPTTMRSSAGVVHSMLTMVPSSSRTQLVRRSTSSLEP